GDEAVRSCLMFAVQAQGKPIRTVEGLADGDKLHPLQAAFIAHHGLQCGFCTPGFLMLPSTRWGPIPASPTRGSSTCSRPISAAAPAIRTSSRRCAAPRPSCAVRACAEMPIDVHAHYVPPQLIAAIDARGKDIGVSLTRADGATPALQFAYGFKVR